MGKYLITGRPGSGKTTVIRELQKRGFTAYNTDELKGVTRLEEKKSGKTVKWPKEGGVDWDNVAWNWQRAEILELLDSNDQVFVGAIVSNQQDFYSLFDKIFLLTLDAESLHTRLEEHEHIRTNEEKSRLVKNHDIKQGLMIKDSMALIPSTQPVEQIVDEILSYVSE